MELNAYIFAEDLSDYWSSHNLISDPNINEISHFDVFRSDSSIDPAALTLINSDQINDLEAFEGKSLIIYGATVALSSLPPWIAQNDYFVVREDVGFAMLFEAISHEFAIYNSWQETMHEVLSKDGSIDDLVKVSLDICKCNIMISDINHRVISHRQYSPAAPESAFSDLVKDSQFTKQQLKLIQDSFMNNPGMRHPFRIKGPHSIKWIDGPRDLSLNVSLPEGYVVRINMSMPDHTTDISNKHYALIKELGRFVNYAYLLFTYQMADMHHFEALGPIKRLLEGERVSKHVLARSAHEMGWSFHDDLYVTAAVVLLHEGDSSYTERKFTIRSVADRLASSLSFAVPIFPDDIFCILINYTKASYDAFSDCVEFLERFAEDNNALVVTSHVNQGLRHCKYGFDHVKPLIEYAQEVNLKEGVYTADNLSLEFAYQTLSSNMDPFFLVPYGLIELIHRDNQKGSELYPALRAYIECDCSPVKAAKQLFVDRSTFYRRLEQIVATLNMDLNHPSTKFKLMLGFMILDRQSEHTLKNI